MWAAYFSFLRAPFVYEPEGFDLGPSGYYLPDFYLPKIDSFVEIKPDFIVDGRESPCEALANETEKRVILIFGRPRVWDHSPCEDGEENPIAFFKDGMDMPYWPCLCENCNAFGFEFYGRSARIGCGCDIHKNSDKNYNSDNKILRDAVSYSVAATRWKR